MDRNNLIGGGLRFAVAAVLFVVGTGLLVTGLGLFTPEWWFPLLAALGLGLWIGAAFSAVLGIAALRQRNSYGDLDPTPSLSPTDFRLAIDAAPHPSWTCTQCRVVGQGIDYGVCAYCGEKSAYFRIDSDADANLVLASLP